MFLLGSLMPCLACFLKVACVLGFCSVLHVTPSSTWLVSEAQLHVFVNFGVYCSCLMLQPTMTDMNERFVAIVWLKMPLS